MAKIFTSYKYWDTGVRPIEGVQVTKARDYVDLLDDYLRALGHINKSESDDEDISNLSDDTISQKLNDRIYDSSVTIVLISKNMKEERGEKDQWIPREVSYSLTENNRGGMISHTNAMLAIVIPDENHSYEYYIESKDCPHCNTITWKNSQLFDILSSNMFNRVSPKQQRCRDGACNSNYHIGGDHSYIHPVKWDDFIYDINKYVDHAISVKENIDHYNITKELK